MRKFTTIEEHNKFLEKMKENPQAYDFGGRGPWEYGQGFSDKTCIIVTLHCPKCGSNNGWTQSHAGIYSYDECQDCHWMGNREDLLTREQLINNERFEKLDEIVGSGIIEGNIFPTEDDIYLK